MTVSPPYLCPDAAIAVIFANESRDGLMWVCCYSVKWSADYRAICVRALSGFLNKPASG